jgi:hypothetical protein
MTDEYLEELLRFVGKLCPKFLEGKYEGKDYDPSVNAIYREYLGAVGVTSMKRLNTDQLRRLNRLCRDAKEKADEEAKRENERAAKKAAEIAKKEEEDSNNA